MATSSFYSSTGPTAEDVTALQGFKNDAEASKNAAAASAAAAAVSENNSGNSAVDSQNAQQASEAARNAAIAARDAALLSETTATSAAASSLAQAGIASTKANEASASESTATTEAAEAAASAAAALLSEDNSSASETASAASAAAALSSENNASGSATTATSQAGIATTKASEASSSAANALSSENAASGSSASALAQAGIATTKAGEAAVSASDALVSEGNASNSATSAATAQTAAEAARDAALAAFDSFDDRYLGPYSSDPTTDNDGDALSAGMLYFNTSTDDMKVYEGSSWVNAYASLSGALLATNNLSDLNNAGTARTNLGLGTAATTAASDYATAAQADQTVSLTGAGTTTVSGTYPNFTITGAGTTYTAGSGLSLTGTEFANTAPDQTVTLTGAGTTTVSGTYPNFTITGAGTTYTASNGITLSGTDFQLTDTNAKLNLTGGTLTGNLIIDQGTSGDATLTLRADTDNNDEGDHPQIRFQQDGDLVNYRFGIGTSATDTATSNNDLCITAEGSASSQLYMVTSAGVQHKFWHAGNDGTGSGLDADLLKGYNISAGGNRWGVIPAIDANGVMEVGEYIDFHENDNNQSDHAFRLQSDGNVGGASLTAHGHLVLNNGATNGARLYLRSNVAPTFGINNNGGNLVFDDGTEVMRLNYQNRVGIGTSSPAQALHVVGSIVATGNITAYYSDERLKDFKGKIDNPLEKINTLNGYYFKPNETALIAGAEQNGLEVGVSAQEVEKVLPEIVSPSALGKDYKTVSYEKLTPLLIEAVKELSAKVDDLELRLQNLEK